MPDKAALLVLEELGIESEQVFSFPEVSDMLIVMVASPVNPVVTTADNKKAGYGVNEIINAQYFSAGDGSVKIIAIPNPASGDYSVALTGNNSGSYKMALIYSSDDSTISVETSGEAVTGQNIIYNSNLQTGGNPTMAELTLPAEENSAEDNAPAGGSIPLWFLQGMNSRPKVLGVKISSKEDSEETEDIFKNIFKANLIFSATVEEALLNNLFFKFLPARE